MKANQLSLGGKWRRSIGGKFIDEVDVPGSLAPQGRYSLERTFELPKELSGGGGRYFLCTDGVLSSAEFFLNGTALGKAGPWAFYRFELPAELLKKTNVLRAGIVDILDTFGPMPGRRFDGGLVRDIWIERRPAVFLEHFAFRCTLDSNFSRAECRVEAGLNGAAKAPAHIRLAEKETGRVVAEAATSAGNTACFQLDNPRLWSPQTPNLYTLRVTLAGEGGESLEESVGFKKIEVRNQDIFLNGKRLILKGVCRHEFTDEYGYSPPETEIRRELGMIKHAGFNYIRLVHSPQSGRVCRIAAELGIMVSEEPGTCFHDLSDEAVAAPALECLRRTVLRDRNAPSIIAWHIYNECLPCTPYAVNAAKICRGLDPDCRLSYADCSGRNDEIKAMTAAADLSWYGINIYNFHANPYTESAKAFQDRPFLITEWGGWCGQGNPRVLKSLCDMFARHTQPDAAPRMAGCSFWAWADYEERSRPGPAAIDGWTIEGLVDRRGAPKDDLYTLSQMCFDMDHPPAPRQPVISVLSSAPRRKEDWRQLALPAGGGAQEALESQIAEMRKPYAGQNPSFGLRNLAGVDFACLEKPLLLGKAQPEILIPAGQLVRRLAFLGQAALKGGYPSSAVWSVHHRDAEPNKEFGAEASEYIFEFEDGAVTQVLQHGLHILRANNICRWWLTNPRSPETLPAVQALIHPSFEILRLDLWETVFPKPRMLKAIRWRLKDAESIQALYAVSFCG